MKFLLFFAALLFSCHAFGQKMSFALPSSYPDSIITKPYSQEKVKKKGYACVNEFGGLFGIRLTAFTYEMAEGNQGIQPNHPYKRQSRYSDGFIAMRTSHGYQFNSKLFLGASLEMDVSRDDGYLNFLLPICAELRYSPLKKRITPIINERLGYTIDLIPLDLKYKIEPGGGPISEAQIGLRIYISAKVAFHFSIGYRLQDFICKSSQLPYYSSFKFYNYQGKFAGILDASDSYQVKPPPAHVLEHFVTLMAGLSF